MGSCKYTQELITDNSSNISANDEFTDSDGNTFISCNSTNLKAAGTRASGVRGDAVVAAFKSYVPFTGPTYTSSMKGNSINADGSCCYMQQTNTELAYIEKDHKAVFERTGKDFCTTDFLISDISGIGIKTVGEYATTYDGSSTVFVCGKPSNNTLENFTGSVGTEVSNNIGGFKALIFIVIGVLLTTLAYAIFILTPFFYWTNAGNPKISNDENNCFKGVSLLDRFYPGDAERYPYSENDSCKPKKISYIPSSSCIQSDIRDNGNGEEVASLILSKITELLQRFPYSLITCDKEKSVQKYNGEVVFLYALTICIIVALSISAKTNVNVKIVLTVFIPIGIWLLNRIIIPYFRCRYCNPKIQIFQMDMLGRFLTFKDKVENYKTRIDYVTPIVMLLSIVGLGISCAAMHDNNSVLNNTTSAIISFIILIVYAFAGSKSEHTDDSFIGLMRKIGYNILKRIVITFRESTRISRKGVNYILKSTGNILQYNIPPHWFITIFGSFLIPIYVAILFLIRGVCSFFGGLINGETQLYKSNKGGAYCYRDYSKSSKVAPAPSKMRLVASIIPWWLTFMPFTISFLSTFINSIFMFFSYHIIPLLNLKYLKNIINCNIKSLIFLFGIKILIILWGFHSKGTDYVPHQALIWMTVTFVCVIIWNLLVK